MKTWTYSWLIYPFLYTLAAVLGLFKPKVRDTLRLRAWKDFLSLRFNAGQPIEYWVHVASHGELEYAIPILQELERRKKRVLVTYYSISAKRPVEQLPSKFPNVSLVVPLPHDGLGLMKEFVALVRKQGVSRLLLMKYELWPGLLWECNALGIKVILVDALRPSWFHRRLLHKLDGILSGYSSEVAGLDHPNVQVLGDTRVERVLERVGHGECQLTDAVSSKLRAALGDRPVIVCGSMWPADTRCVQAALKVFLESGGRCHVVWVPHELEQSEAEQASVGFRQLGFKVCNIDDADKLVDGLSGAPLAIIVMKKGILAELYRLGRAAYVGGGYGSGVHSVWEPALAGAMVACGPGTERSPESTELRQQHRLESVNQPEELVPWMKRALVDAPGATRAAQGGDGKTAGPDVEPLESILKRHIGAAKRIVEACERM